MLELVEMFVDAIAGSGFRAYNSWVDWSAKPAAEDQDLDPCCHTGRVLHRDIETG